jgi:hypothetical protein
MHWKEWNGDEITKCQQIKNPNDGSVLNVTISMIPKKGIQKPESAMARVLKTFLIPGAARNVKSSRQKKAYLNE